MGRLSLLPPLSSLLPLPSPLCALPGPEAAGVVAERSAGSQNKAETKTNPQKPTPLCQ